MRQLKLIVRPCAAVVLLTLALCACMAGGCCSTPYKWRQSFDPPLNYQGREYICLHNLERLLDAKQEWAKQTCARVGSLSPSPQVLAHRYFRIYEYGRRHPCDDDTQNLPVSQAICPSGGQYIIGVVGERPKCTFHGDLLRDYDRHIFVPHTH